MYSSRAADFYEYQIEKSARFDYGSYTSFTPASNGDLKHFTWSVWVKFTRLDLSSTYSYINTVYGTSGSGNCSSSTRGVFAGFYPSPYTIEYISFPTQGDSVDFGDLNYHGYYNGSCSNGHGGL